MFDLPGMNGVSEVVNEEAVNGNAEPLHISGFKKKPANHITKYLRHDIKDF